VSYSKPICVGILLCDQVIEDIRTRKKSFIGVFNEIVAMQLPAKHPMLCLVVTLTGCLGKQEFEIVMSRQTDYGDEPVMRIQGGLQARSPLDIIDLIFELRDVPLVALGRHTIELRVLPEGERVAERSFFVKEFPKPEPPNQARE
jgi:hypothetical protein